MLGRTSWALTNELPSLLILQNKRDHLGSVSLLDRVLELWKSMQWTLRSGIRMYQSQGELTGQMQQTQEAPSLGPSLSPAPECGCGEPGPFSIQMLPVWWGRISQSPPTCSSFKPPIHSLGRQLSAYYLHFAGEENESPRELRSHGEIRLYCPGSKLQLFPHHQAVRSQEGPQVPILLRSGLSFPTNPSPPGQELGGLVPASQSMQDK